MAEGAAAEVADVALSPQEIFGRHECEALTKDPIEYLPTDIAITKKRDFTNKIRLISRLIKKNIRFVCIFSHTLLHTGHIRLYPCQHIHSFFSGGW